MIKVTRLNDSVLMINVEMIQSLQATPDTLITFTNNDRLMVKEPVEEISQRILEYQRAVNPITAEKSGDTLELIGFHPKKAPENKGRFQG